MRGAAAVAVITLSLIAFNLVQAAKEEAVEDDTLNRVTNPLNNMYDSQVDYLASLEPEELLPFCHNLVDFYQHVRKRNNFNPWGGKRSAPVEVEKKNFNPWGGKRIMLQEWSKKNNFNPWGGKRSQQANSYLLSRTTKNDPDNRKPVFNPWGGR